MYTSMENNWKTMNEDIQIAEKILEIHFKNTKEIPMVVQKHIISKEGDIKIEKSKWVLDIEKMMIERHGSKQGPYFTNKILSHLIIRESLYTNT